MTIPILLDVDEVLLQWNTGFEAFMDDIGHRRVHGATSWDLHESYPSLGGDEPRLRHLMKKFSHSEAFSKLKAVEFCAYGVDQFRQVYPGCLIVAVTSCGDDEVTTSNRRFNLKLRDIKVHGLITLPLHACKRKVYRAFAPGIVIDDAIHNLEAAEDCGHQAVAFDRPWNQEWQGDRVFQWNTIPRLIKEDLAA